MKIEGQYEFTTFNQAETGSLLMAVVGGIHPIYGIKGFRKDEDRDRQEFLITIGPFVESDGDHPVVYQSNEVQSQWVLELSADHVFVPFLDPKGMICCLPEKVKGFGTVCFGEEGTFLVAENPSRRPLVDRLLFCNIESGEIIKPRHELFFSTSHWQLVRKHEGGRVCKLLEFPAGAASG